jgi:hypothetical protein
LELSAEARARFEAWKTRFDARHGAVLTARPAPLADPITVAGETLA